MSESTLGWFPHSSLTIGLLSLQFSDMGLLGAVILRSDVWRRFTSKENMNFLSQFDR